MQRVQRTELILFQKLQFSESQFAIGASSIIAIRRWICSLSFSPSQGRNAASVRRMSEYRPRQSSFASESCIFPQSSSFMNEKNSSAVWLDHSEFNRMALAEPIPGSYGKSVNTSIFQELRVELPPQGAKEEGNKKKRRLSQHHMPALASFFRELGIDPLYIYKCDATGRVVSERLPLQTPLTDPQLDRLLVVSQFSDKYFRLVCDAH